MKYGKVVRVQGKKANRWGVRGKQMGLENLESRVLMSTVTVSPVGVVEGNTTKMATLTARLNAASASNVVLVYATQDGTATSGVNYAPTTSFVVIPAGQTSATFNIPVLANNLHQGTTSFGVNLAVTPGNRLAQSRTTVYIADNDAAPRVAIGDVSVTAGSGSQTAFVPVTLSSASAMPVTVSYATMNGTALAGMDYQAKFGSVTFAAGETAKVIPVTVNAGTGAGDKAFDVVLTGATGGTLASVGGGWEHGRVAIRDGMGWWNVRPTLTVSSAGANAGDVERFNVTLSAPTTKTVTLRYHTMAMTAGESSYVPADGLLTIPAGSKTGTIAVQTRAGSGTDGSFALVLTAATNANLASPVAWGNIVSIPPTVSVSDANVMEGDSGTATMTFTVTLSKASSQAVTVDYATADLEVSAIPQGNLPQVGTPWPYAHEGSDYVATNGTLTFAPGQTSKTVSVTVNGDTSIERDEPFNLVLSNASGATIATGTGVGTIDNDDVGSLSVSSPTVSVVDGDSETLTFTVTLSNSSPFTVTAGYATADGTAVAGTDYTAASGTLTFAPGETTKTIDVTVSGNSVSPEETLGLKLSNLTNASGAGASGTGTIEAAQILSDNLDGPNDGGDGAGLTAANFRTGSSDVDLISVSLKYGSQPTSVKIYTDSSGQPGTEVGTLTYAGGNTFTADGITLSANTTYWVVNEGGGWLFTSGGGTGEGFLGGEAISVNGGASWLQADPSFTFPMQVKTAYSGPQISIDSPSVTEEVGNNTTQTMHYTVTLSSAASFPVTVHYATADGTAADGVDYTGTSGTLTFAPGETSKTIDVTVSGNTLQADETFDMNLSNAGNGAIAAATGTGTIASATVLSDNLSEASSGYTSVDGTQWLAAKFSTGSSGVNLASVTIPLWESVAGPLTMKIYTESGGQPDTLVGTLTSPGSFSTGGLANATFTASGITLSASTNYWVVLETSSGEYSWGETASPNGTGVGFSPQVVYSNDNGLSWGGTGLNMQMQVVVLS
jgi:chitinase